MLKARLPPLVPLMYTSPHVVSTVMCDRLRDTEPCMGSDGTVARDFWEINYVLFRDVFCDYTKKNW